MNASQLKKSNEELAFKNKRALAELDKVTEQLAEAQKIATELNARLDGKKHSEQLAGWAIDRAIESAKVTSEKPHDIHEVIGLAEQILAGVDRISGKQKETIQ